MISKKYKRNSALLAARSVIRRSIRLLTNKKVETKKCATTHQGKFHQDCIQNKKMFEKPSSKTPLKPTVALKSSNFQTPRQDVKKLLNQDKVYKTLPTKLNNLKNTVTMPNNAAKLTLVTPKSNKVTLSRVQDKNSKTVNVTTRTPSLRTRLQLQQQHEGESPRAFSQTMKKTPSLANTVLSRQLFVKNSQSTTKLTSTITSRIAGSARRSLGFLKKACSSSSLNKFSASKIPRPVNSLQSSNLVINKVNTETEVFKQVAEILNNSESEDKVVEIPVQALKILYDTPNRDKILKILQKTPIVSMDIEPDQVIQIEEDTQPAIVEQDLPVVLNENEDLMHFDSISDEEIKNNEKGLENELANQNQIEVLENEILINKTPVNIKENEKRMFKLIHDQHQHQQQRNSILNKTSEIISPFAMNQMFKSQQPRHNEVLTPHGLKRTFKIKTKNGEIITPYGMKNLFKHHKENGETENQVMSPYAMKNLFKRHQENIEPDNIASASPFTMKNLFKEHKKKELSGIAATPYTMKNLFKHYQEKNGDIHATPLTMKNLFKKDSVKNNENLSPVALKSLFRNKIINKQHLLNVEAMTTPLSMKNLFKINDKKLLCQDVNAVLSPTVFNCMFDENNKSPLSNVKLKKKIEAQTPTEKLDSICDKLINNELELNQQVQDELLKVDSCVLINHIIELKQQVKALESFSEQIIESIDETIEEIDEQMSVQYPEEIEEVILSVDYIASKEDVDNQVQTIDEAINEDLEHENEVQNQFDCDIIQVEQNNELVNGEDKREQREQENDEIKLNQECQNETIENVEHVESHEQVNEEQVESREQVNEEHVESYEQVNEVELVSEAVVAESIINSQPIVEVINEAVNEVHKEEQVQPASTDIEEVEVKIKRGGRKVAVSKEIENVQKPKGRRAAVVENEITEVKKTRGRKAAAAKDEQNKVIEVQPVDAVDSKKVTRKGPRGKKAEEHEDKTAIIDQPKSTRGRDKKLYNNDDKLTGMAIAQEEEKPAGRRGGRKKVEEVKEANTVKLQEILEIEPVVEATTSKKRGSKKVSFEVENTAVEDEQPEIKSRGRGRNAKKPTVEIPVEEAPKKQVGRRHKNVETVVSEVSSTQEESVEVEPKRTRSKRKVATDDEDNETKGLTSQTKTLRSGNKKVKL